MRTLCDNSSGGGIWQVFLAFRTLATANGEEQATSGLDFILNSYYIWVQLEVENVQFVILLDNYEYIFFGSVELPKPQLVFLYKLKNY